jgi:hypothetical protein
MSLGEHTTRLWRDPAAGWAWEQPDLQEQILHLRRAIAHPGFEALDLLRRCQILTNLANSLNTVGRFVLQAPLP